MKVQTLFIILIAFFALSLIFSKQIQDVKLWFINRKLKKALAKKEQKRLKLKHRLMVSLRNFMRLNGISEYIPYDHKSREKIRLFIEKNFQEELDKLDVHYKITKNNGFRFL